MSAFAINALCTAHRWNPGLTVTMADRIAQFLGGAKQDEPTPALASSIGTAMLLGVGLLAIVSVPAAARKTIRSGNASFLDIFLICAGQHTDHHAPRLSNAEYPACAAMTTGYVFRVENEAMVYYMQQVGKTGQLTTLTVSSQRSTDPSTDSAMIIYIVCALWTVSTGVQLAYLGDIMGSLALGIYILCRLVNTLIIIKRAVPGWKGKLEPGEKSDLLVLLSQDRWIRLQGLTDDVKAVTSGEWLRKSSFIENLLTTLTTMLLCLNAGLVAGSTVKSKMTLLILILGTTILIEVANELTDSLTMHGRRISIDGRRKKYERRLDLGKELVQETGHDEWCEKMGIVLTSKSSRAGQSTGVAHM